MVINKRGLRILIRIILGSWIQIWIRVKSSIRIRIEVKIQSIRGTKQSRGGLEAQNEALEGL